MGPLVRSNILLNAAASSLKVVIGIGPAGRHDLFMARFDEKIAFVDPQRVKSNLKFVFALAARCEQETTVTQRRRLKTRTPVCYQLSSFDGCQRSRDEKTIETVEGGR
jgi:hypothetical protein